MIKIGPKLEKRLNIDSRTLPKNGKIEMNEMNKIKRLSTVVYIFLCISSLIPIQSAVAESDGNLHGTVVDLDGQPIYRAKVTVYTTGGSIVDTKYTNKDGFFRFSLGGTYNIVFEKEGYISVQRNVQVTKAPVSDPENDEVKLGEIVLEKAIELSASVVERITSPGNTLELLFKVKNDGDKAEDIDFTVTAPVNWDAKIRDSLGEIKSIQMEPGVETFTIKFTVPPDADQTEIITITASGTYVSSLDFIITPVKDTESVDVKSTYISISEELGQTIHLPITITNNDEVDKKITLTGTAPTNWSFQVKSSTDMVVKSLLIAPGSSEKLTLELEPSDAAQTGDYIFSVNVIDDNGLVYDTLEFEVNLREAVSEIEVISSYSEVSVEAGESVTFPLVVWNKGEADALTLFTVPVLPANWDASFKADDLEIASIQIAGDESESIKLIVKPPNSVISGLYEMKVVIESDDGGQHELDFLIEVVGSYNLNLELSTLYTTVTIGGTVTYTAKVTNRGQTAVTTLYLDAVLPEDWEASITPTQVSSLDPRDSETFTIIADVPSDTEAGDYLVTMHALSDQLESDEIDVRITAQASNTWGYIGIGLALIAVVGAVIIFRRFKRR